MLQLGIGAVVAAALAFGGLGSPGDLTHRAGDAAGRGTVPAAGTVATVEGRCAFGKGTVRLTKEWLDGGGAAVDVALDGVPSGDWHADYIDDLDSSDAPVKHLSLVSDGDGVRASGHVDSTTPGGAVLLRDGRRVACSAAFLDFGHATLVGTDAAAVIVRETGPGEVTVRVLASGCRGHSSWELEAELWFGPDHVVGQGSEATCHNGRLRVPRAVVEVEDVPAKVTSARVTARSASGRVRRLAYDISSLDRTPPPADPAPAYDDMPVGAPTSLPWWYRGRLHVGDTVIETSKSDLASRNGTTVVGKGEFARLGRPTRWSVVDGSVLVPLPMRADADQPLISANGRWAGWLEERVEDTDSYRRHVRYRVVVYDTDQSRIVASLRDRRLVEWGDGINGIWLRTLSNDGRLVLTQGDDGRKVLSATGLVDWAGPEVNESTDVDGWPGGTTFLRHDRSVLGTVDEDGTFTQTDSFELSFAGRWSPDGSTYAVTGGTYGRPTAWARPLDGEPFQLVTPRDVWSLQIAGWESADALVLRDLVDWGDTQRSRLLRCFVSTGACEQVPGGPGPHGTMPSLY